jgi:indole-3-glycerol phosphate synthase/phosphoribosylanthranilate isomerase
LNSILQNIIDKRELDKEQGVKNFGFTVPKTRKRLVTPFLPERGVILEIKRASPSKGDIKPDLSPRTLALAYQKAGAAAISVLTETNYFKGSLQDIVEVAEELDYAESFNTLSCKKPAILRKDFLTDVSEIDVSYKIGADAVLLIARILTIENLIKMAIRCVDLGLGMLVELRTDEDIEKYHKLLSALAKNGKSLDTIVVGTNTRDLATFAIDLLKPLTYGDRLPKKMIFESGIHTEMAAKFAGSLGFYGMLVGEEASKNPQKAKFLVSAFLEGTAKNNTILQNNEAWKKYARMLGERTLSVNSKKSKTSLPLVKICGITNEQDALKAAELGANFLGFIMVSKSPRNVQTATITSICKKVRSKYPELKFVGVITNPTSAEGKNAQELATKGILDVVQFHNCATDNQTFWHYQAIKIGTMDDILILENILNSGQPRVLIDAKVNGKDGGTGVCISEELVNLARQKMPLWLAGGITPENVGEMVKKFSPELIDVSSGVESLPGKKDYKKLDKLFENICH